MILEYINQTWTVLVLYSTWRAGHLVVRLKHSIHTHYNLSGGNAAAHYCVFILSITQRTREQTCTHVKSSLLLLEFRGRGQFSGQGHLNSRRELRLAFLPTNEWEWSEKLLGIIEGNKRSIKSKFESKCCAKHNTFCFLLLGAAAIVVKPLSK